MILGSFATRDDTLRRTLLRRLMLLPVELKLAGDDLNDANEGLLFML